MPELLPPALVRRCLCAAPLCLALTGAPAVGAGLALEPARACGLLDDQGLRTRDGYREIGRGVFECASINHRVPRGSPARDEVRFVATGDRSRVRQLRLDLSLSSRGDVRPVLDAFASLAVALTSRALNEGLPGDARQAIAAGTAGTWHIGGAQVALERITGALAGLRVVIR